MSAHIFIANQLHKYFPTDTLVKVGVGTAYIKDPNTNYDFGGAVRYENENVILFHGLPKRIEIDGENMLDLLHYEHNAFLADCCILRQNKTCIFDEYKFEYEGKTYYEIEDVQSLLAA